jgi:hypothetical protein
MDEQVDIPFQRQNFPPFFLLVAISNTFVITMNLGLETQNFSPFFCLWQFQILSLLP